MWRTLVLWVVLIVLFVAFYQYFAHQSGGQGRPAPPETVDLVATWLPRVVLVAFGVLFLFFLQRGVANSRLAREGAELLGRGRYVEALGRFEKFTLREKKSPAGPYNIGVTRLMLWQLDPAIDELRRSAALCRAGHGHTQYVKPRLPPMLALALGLSGRLDEAAAQLKEAAASPTDDGHLTLAKAVLAVRRGDADAAALLERFEVRQLGGMMGALAVALRSFCVERATGERRHVDRVALFGETGPEVLKVAWPELADFVQRAPAA